MVGSRSRKLKRNVTAKQLTAAWHRKRMAAAQALRDAREAKGLSVSELAYRCGVSQAAVYKLENGTRYPSYRTATALAGVLDVPVSQLMGET